MTAEFVHVDQREVTFRILKLCESTASEWFLTRLLSAQNLDPDGLSNAATIVGIKFGWLRSIARPALPITNRVMRGFVNASNGLLYDAANFFASSFFDTLSFNNTLFYQKLTALLNATADGYPRWTVRHNYMRVLPLTWGTGSTKCVAPSFCAVWTCR